MATIRLKAVARTAIVLGVLAPATGRAAVVTEIYTDRAAFEARLGTVRVVTFDDVATGAVDPASFAADRYAATEGVVITGEEGQYASPGFGFPAEYPPSSAPNEYAPGPIENLFGGNQTTVDFLASGQPAAVAGFGAVFIDPDLADVSGFTVFDGDGMMLRRVGVPQADRSLIFRGIVTADDVSGAPTPAIARVEIVNGTGWPGGQFNDGVPLDDFVFGVPAVVAGSTTTTTITGATTTTTTTTTLPCPPAPATGCRRPVVSGTSKLRVRNVAPGARDLLRWIWTNGAATSREDFGDPTTRTAYAACAYSASDLVFAARIPAGGICGAKLCWKTTRTGFRYTNPGLAPDGIFMLGLRAGGEGSARITLVGRGGGLALPELPLTTPVTVQLVRDDGGPCWDVRYSLAKKNTTRQLRTSAD